MTAIPDKIKPQPSLFDAPPVSVADRLEMAWTEWKKRKVAGVSVVEGVWDDRPEMIHLYGVIVWFPARKWACCKNIDARDEAIKKRPRKFEEHVCSYLHVATMFDVEPLALEKYAKQRDKQTADSRDAYIMGAIREEGR